MIPIIKKLERFDRELNLIKLKTLNEIKRLFSQNKKLKISLLDILGETLKCEYGNIEYLSIDGLVGETTVKYDDVDILTLDYLVEIINEYLSENPIGYDTSKREISGGFDNRSYPAAYY